VSLLLWAGGHATPTSSIRGVNIEMSTFNKGDAIPISDWEKNKRLAVVDG
jgi:hypothetical protein